MSGAVLQIDQGDDETIHMAVKSPLAADAPVGVTWSATDTSTWGPLNITGSKLWFAIKTTDGTVVLIKTTDALGGITITDAPGGLADVAISNADTSALADALTNKSLRLEVQVRSAAGKITTLKRGTITIVRDRIIAT